MRYKVNVPSKLNFTAGRERLHIKLYFDHTKIKSEIILCQLATIFFFTC
jgi:hypothetical protein